MTEVIDCLLKCDWSSEDFQTDQPLEVTNLLRLYLMLKKKKQHDKTIPREAKTVTKTKSPRLMTFVVTFSMIESGGGTPPVSDKIEAINRQETRTC